MSRRIHRLLAAAVCALGAPVAVLADPADAPSLTLAAALTPAQALSIAAARDAGHAALTARADAWRQDAVAENQLPDPEVVVGLENVPLDSPSLRDDNMTMATVGLMQRFPPAGERAARQAGALAQAGAQDAGAAVRTLDTRRAVRRAYLSVALAEARQGLLAQALDAAREAESLTRAAYAGGRGGQGALIQAGLDALRMDDRAQAAAGARQEARAELARWLGPDARRPLPPGLPTPDDLTGPRTGVVPAAHPALAARDADIANADSALALARSAYRPEFALEGRYGLRQAHDDRGRALPDMGGVMATVSLPVLTGARQDRRLAAARARLAAARHARVDEQRALAARLEAAGARLQQLSARLALYDTQLLVRAETLTASARAAVEAGTGTPAGAARAHLGLLELTLERLDLAAQALRAHIDITWLEGH